MEFLTNITCTSKLFFKSTCFIRQFMIFNKIVELQHHQYHNLQCLWPGTPAYEWSYMVSVHDKHLKCQQNNKYKLPRKIPGTLKIFSPE